MGGNFQEVTVHDIKNEDALMAMWKLYVEQEKWDHGHAGYSGTFAEKETVEIREKEGYWGARDAEEDAGNNDKWGPAWAYLIEEGVYYIGGWCSS